MLLSMIQKQNKGKNPGSSVTLLTPAGWPLFSHLLNSNNKAGFQGEAQALRKHLFNRFQPRAWQAFVPGLRKHVFDPSSGI